MVTPTTFTIQRAYSRAEIRTQVGDPGRGGAWDTGYRQHRQEFFVFAGVGTAGRTGHDYKNQRTGGRLIWEAKNGTSLDNPQIRRLIGGRFPVHIFTREKDRDAFVYEGFGVAIDAADTDPVTVTWRLDAQFRPPLTADQVVAELRKLGFSVDSTTVKSHRAQRGDLVVYVKRESSSFVLAVHPDNAARHDALKGISGVRRPAPADWLVHNQTFWDFPTRRHTGLTPRPYGLDFDVDDAEALARFIAAIEEPALPPVPPASGIMEADDLILVPKPSSRTARPPMGYRRSKRAKEVGDWAEETVVRFLEAQGGCAQIAHRAALGETPGWDIDYRDAAGVLHRVEVKGTIAATFSTLDLTAKELGAAQTHGEGYWIFLVSNCLTDGPRIQRIRDPRTRLFSGDWVATPAVFSVRLG